MKKILVIVCICIMLLSFTGCDAKYTLSDVTAIMAKSPTAYTVETTLKTGELTSTSSLKIGKTGEVYSAEYSYSIQKYNEIGSSLPTEQISTTNGKQYYNGTQVGQLVGDKVEWKLAPTEGVVPNGLVLEDATFSEVVVTGTETSLMLVGKVSTSQIEKLLGVADLTNVVVEINIDVASQSVTSINITYKQNDIDCTITTTFGYTLNEVTIPQA